MEYYFNNELIVFSKKTSVNMNYKYLSFDKYAYTLGYTNTMKIPTKVNSKLFEFINEIGSTSRMNSQDLEIKAVNTPFGDVKNIGMIKKIDKDNLSINVVDFNKVLFDNLKNTSLQALEFNHLIGADASHFFDWCTHHNAIEYEYFYPDYIFYPLFINGNSDGASYEGYFGGVDLKKAERVNNFLEITMNDTGHTKLLYVQLAYSSPFIKFKFIIEAIEIKLGVTFVDASGNKFTDFINENYLSLKSHNEAFPDEPKYKYYREGDMTGLNIGLAFPEWTALDFLKSIFIQNSLYFTVENNIIQVRKIKDLLLPSNIINVGDMFYKHSVIDKNFAYKLFRKRMLFCYAGRNKQDMSSAIGIEFNEDFIIPKDENGKEYFKMLYGENKEIELKASDGTSFGTFGSLQKFFHADHICAKMSCDIQDYDIHDDSYRNDETFILVEEFSESFQTTVDTEFLNLLAGMYDYGDRVTFLGFLKISDINMLRLPLVIETPSFGKYFINEIKYKENKETKVIATKINDIKANIIIY